MENESAAKLVSVLRECLYDGQGIPAGTELLLSTIRKEIEPLVRLAAVPHCEYLDEKAASLYCSTPVATLQRKRCDGKGPAYIKDGAKVLYARKDLDRYMESRKVRTYENEPSSR